MSNRDFDVQRAIIPPHHPGFGSCSDVANGFTSEGVNRIMAASSGIGKRVIIIRDILPDYDTRLFCK